MSAAACAAEISRAAGRELSDDEIIAIAEAVQTRRKALEREFGPNATDQKLLEQARADGEAEVRRRAHERRLIALRIIKRDKRDRQIDSFIGEGAAYDDALRWTLEGTVRGYKGGRRSAAAHRLAYESRYLGGMVTRLQRELPHLLSDRAKLLHDRKFNADVVREMHQPGATRNADARRLAEIFAEVTEASRQDLNRLGADIGKLEGWAGSQSHDPDKLLAAGEDAWIAEQMQRLDLERSFGDEAGDAEAILRTSWRTIVTGVQPGLNPRRVGQQTQPANVARSLGKERIFHYKSADDWLAYHEQFGGMTLAAGMIQHLKRNASTAAQMEMFGPEPEAMIASISEALKQRARELLPPKEAAEQAQKLSVDEGPLRQAIDEMTGLTSSPVARSAAKIASNIRLWQSISKLGGAVIS